MNECLTFLFVSAPFLFLGNYRNEIKIELLSSLSGVLVPGRENCKNLIMYITTCTVRARLSVKLWKEVFFLFFFLERRVLR